MAEALAHAGANIIIHGVKETEASIKAFEALKAIGHQVWFCPCDLSQPDAAQTLYQNCQGQAGQVDIFISNASVQCRTKFFDVTSDEIDFQFVANFKSAYQLVQLLAPSMMERNWGRIITIGSVQEENHHPQFSVYGALKAAQTHLVCNLAKHQGGKGVTFNNIAPGAINTDRNTDVLSQPDIYQKVLGMIPSGRIGESEDCAGIALLLCSDAGSYINGANIFVDGGMRL
ncbi:MAG: SDR family NAD(P)-dependent oxidoreductase [bacterium]|nr:SDR family NAD(P)-dependent oxidoreductase [bacterium]